MVHALCYSPQLCSMQIAVRKPFTVLNREVTKKKLLRWIIVAHYSHLICTEVFLSPLYFCLVSSAYLVTAQFS
jgi:hypothetical protein